LRIVYLHQYFRTPAMSGGTRSYEWAARLAARGHEVHVVTSDTTGKTRLPTGPLDGIHVHWISIPYDNSMTPRKRLWAFLKFALLASRRARRLNPELVVATSTPLTIILPALAAIWRRNVPLVFEVRDLWPEIPIAMGALRDPVSKYLARQLERISYKHATRVIALSPEMAAGVEAAGFPPYAISLVPNASDEALFRPPGLAGAAAAFRDDRTWLKDRPLLLYAGTLGKANDVSFLPAVAAHCVDLMPELRFLVAGAGAEEQLVRSTARRLGVLDRNFFMMPPVAKDAMPVLLAAATVTASLFADIPALTANSPNKVFDSLAAERPVAVNTAGSLSALLEATGSGVTLSRQPALAARKLCDFLGDESALARGRTAASLLGATTFSRDRLFLRFERTLMEASREGRVAHRLAPRNHVGESPTSWTFD
jgi:glycosyltransferase involved in cell wall biosynthesis